MSDKPTRPSAASVAAEMTRLREEMATKDDIKAMSDKVDGLAADLQKLLADQSVAAPVKHRKHVPLGKVVRDLKLRIAELEKRDPAAPGYAEAVNTELARIGKRVDDAYTELEPRVAKLEATVADHSTNFEKISKMFEEAAGTALVQGGRIAEAHDRLDGLTPRVDGLEKRSGDLEASVAALASANPGRRKAPWGLAALVGIGGGIGAGFIARNWTDQSMGWSWFVGIVVGVAIFWIVASFDKVTDSQVVAAASARVRRTPTTPPSGPTVAGMIAYHEASLKELKVDDPQYNVMVGYHQDAIKRLKGDTDKTEPVKTGASS